MALHFAREEFAERQKRACAEMAKAGLDGLLIFRQESMYYLTGYDTSGYSMFQGMYLGADGALGPLHALGRPAAGEASPRSSRTSASGPTARAPTRAAICATCSAITAAAASAWASSTTRTASPPSAARWWTPRFAGSAAPGRQRPRAPAPARQESGGAGLSCARRAARRRSAGGLATASPCPAPARRGLRRDDRRRSSAATATRRPAAGRWAAGKEALLVRYHTGHGTVAARDQVRSSSPPPTATTTRR